MKLQRCLQFLFIVLSAAMILLTMDFYRADLPEADNGKEQPRYVFLAPNSREKYWCSIAAGVKAADEVFDTDTLLVEFSGNENIRSYFMDAVFSGVDGIIIKGTGLITEEIQAAGKSGISVVFYDSDVRGSGRDCYVGVDNYETGVMAAQVLAEELQGEGKLLAIVRSKSAFSQEDRVAALEDELEQYPELEIVEYIEDLGDALILKENLLEAIRRYPDLDGILCMEEIASEHVGNLLREKKLNPEQYFILSLDFTAQTATYLEEGVYDMVLMYDTRQIGYRAVEFLSQGGDESIFLDNVKITRENVKEYQEWYEELPLLEWNAY